MCGCGLNTENFTTGINLVPLNVSISSQAPHPPSLCAAQHQELPYQSDPKQYYQTQLLP
jgi:hypothetical protein